MIEIKDGVFIREEAITYGFSRSAGPGGQNVNKVNTRVTLFFDAAGCESLSDSQKKRILRRLATRANKAGVIRVVSQRYRSQGRNKTAALERLKELLCGALESRAARKKTVRPFSAVQKRLEEKKRRGMLKRQRRTPELD